MRNNNFTSLKHELQTIIFLRVFKNKKITFESIYVYVLNTNVAILKKKKKSIRKTISAKQNIEFFEILS